ncbi:hypothetical protein [Caballeronia sp. RCC_10]|uniref:hypothetical protein n=1 Tax=Caballeronia sp. RCC_10 TaxID=3239227 RepID=UPI0035261E35
MATIAIKSDAHPRALGIASIKRRAHPRDGYRETRSVAEGAIGSAPLRCFRRRRLMHRSLDEKALLHKFIDPETVLLQINS